MFSRNPRNVTIFSVVAFVLVLSVVVQAYLVNNAPEPANRAAERQSEVPRPTAHVDTPTPIPTSTPIPPPTPRPTPTATATPTPTPDPDYPSGFKNVFNYQPIAVMIDNLVDARPQSGLSKADVVYEAVVEGGITRFMAVFGNLSSEVVGPVRSGRHYFMYWASELGAEYVLAGSSPQGYEVAHALDLPRIDYTYGEGYFWRSSDREAPHNLYTDITRLREHFDDSGNGRLGSLVFKNDSPTPRVKTIRLTHPDRYWVSYSYRERDNSYERNMAGAHHVDALTGVQYHPKNVIVQFVSAWPIRGDTAGRMDMELVGSGSAYYFLDGIAAKGTWRKESLTSPTLFLDADGTQFRFNPGQTWIQIAPTDSRLDYE